MAALIIQSTNSKNLKLIAAFAKHLGSKVKTVSAEDLIDFEFEEDVKDELPEFVLNGIERGLEDVKAGRIKSFEEVKEMLA